MIIIISKEHEKRMGRIKINLDQLEEVREQYEIAMNVTEDVISKAREDLNSMAEEV